LKLWVWIVFLQEIIYKKGELSKECFEKYPKLIRPANFETSFPGLGFYRFFLANQHYLVINLNGQVFMEKQFDGVIGNPFLTVDEILLNQSQKGDIILIDFHAEATSEKVAMGFHLDGRVTAVLGTHTHIPTADYRVLPKGTAFTTDVGMTGIRDSVLGVKSENALKKFLEKGKFVNEPEEEGVLMVNGALIQTGENGKAVKIEKLYQEIV
jgi:metallophosphoesterase (TIGR00282 family)